jgi:hypothetical protein
MTKEKHMKEQAKVVVRAAAVIAGAAFTVAGVFGWTGDAAAAQAAVEVALQSNVDNIILTLGGLHIAIQNLKELF